MSLVLTEYNSDNFQRPNVNPLAAPWALDTFGEPGLQIVSDVCEPTQETNTSVGLYSSSLPNDQYASFTLAAALGSNTVALCGVRMTDGGQRFNEMPGYTLGIIDGGVWVVKEQSNLILDGSGLTISPGDVYTLAVVGTTVYAFQNGVQLGSITDTTYASGITALAGVAYFDTTAIQFSNFAIGSAAIGYNVSGNAGAPGATVSYSGTASGSTTADGSGNFSLLLTNGSYTVTPSLTGYQFFPANKNITVSGADVTDVNFTASDPYSVPDCRLNPNGSRVVQGTEIFDVQTSSNPAIPPKDCRAKGAPVDSRTSSVQNSRTQPPFED